MRGNLPVVQLLAIDACIVPLAPISPFIQQIGGHCKSPEYVDNGLEKCLHSYYLLEAWLAAGQVMPA